MFGFLFKVVLMAALVAGGGYFYIHRGNLSQIKQLSNLTSQFKIPDIKQIDASQAGQRISEVLDSLVTHPDKNSPVILGVKITSDSLNTLVDVIAKLPPDQVSQIKQVICAPASPSGQ